MREQLGSCNLVGAKVAQRRRALRIKQKDLLTQLQIGGIELNASGLSKLEGQLRRVTDAELKCLAQVLQVSVDWLLDL